MDAYKVEKVIEKVAFGAFVGGLTLGQVLAFRTGMIHNYREPAELRERIQQCAASSRTAQGTLEGVITKGDTARIVNVRMTQADGTTIDMPLRTDYLAKPDSINKRTYTGRLEGQAQTHTPMRVTYCTANYVVSITPQ